MKYLKKGLSRTIKSIKQHKWLFITLVFLQIIFIGLSANLAINYQIKILDDAKGIIEPLQNANYDENSLKEGEPFIEDFLSVNKSYNSMINNIIALIGWSLLLFIVLNGLIWILTSWIIESNIDWKRRLKDIWQPWFKIIVSLMLTIGPAAVILYFILQLLSRLEILMENASVVLNSIITISSLLYFFIIVAFAFINEVSWKIFFKKWTLCSFKKIHKSLMVLLINIILILLSFYLVYLSIYQISSLGLLLISSLLIVFVIVITRIFWVSCLEEIKNEKNNHHRY
ncbi:MAG: hypothetical protein ABH824_00665 [Nanoarchaeota archaeon]|nr:hypothetical protein [Nanoarchaeota archaeon]MBU1631572.1 hypothetical protein [Nanoarchaeota archaeon]MBU1875488.1 hypothetical protein [Nanoarchaeota archaeon]